MIFCNNTIRSFSKGMSSFTCFGVSEDLSSYHLVFMPFASFLQLHNTFHLNLLITSIFYINYFILWYFYILHWRPKVKFSPSYQWIGFCNLKIVDYLDVTFKLTDSCYRPFSKTNNKINYTYRQPNHLPFIIKQTFEKVIFK